MKFSLSLFLLFIWAALSASAQPLCHISHYSINDGLAQGIIMSYIQDNKGYMWFATWNGLNKFDGYTFETFNASTEGGAALENNRIEYIENGKYDWIWFRTYDQKGYVFDPNTKIFTNVLKSVPPENARTRRLKVLDKGVVWFICDNGFCYRFDETQYKETPAFESYSIHHKNLDSDTVYNILQDTEEDEWILTGKGVKIIGKKVIRSQLPFQYFLEVNNEIWLATRDGQIGKYNKQTGNITTIPLPKKDAKITALNNIGNQLLAIGTTDHGLILYHTTQHTFKVVDIRSPQQTSNYVESMYVDKHHILWISTPSRGVTQWDQAKQSLSHFPPLPSNHIEDKYNNLYFIIEDKNDQLWINPKGGCLNYYDRKKNQLSYFHNDPDNPNSLLGASIHSYFADRQGNLWINTANRNLEKISFFHAPLNTINLGAEARVFFQDNENRLWIATRDKKIRIYDNEGELIGFLNKNGQIVKNESLFSSNIYYITEIDNEIWLGSRDKGLYILRKGREQSDGYHVRNYQHNPSNPSSLSHNAIFSICQDSNKRIWIGCFGGGVNLVERTTGKDIRFIHSNNLMKNYPQHKFSKVRCIVETADGVMLAGTTDGLVSFSSQFSDPKNILFYTYTRDPNNKQSLSNNNISHICNTTQKETYVSTFGGGINKIIFKKPADPETLSFESYGQISELSSNWISSSTEDKENNLWVVSENLISKFNLKTNTFENYKWNLLGTDMFYSEGAPIICTDNNLLLGTNKGFISLSIHEMRKSQYIPPIVLTNIKIFNEEQLIKTDSLSEISLSPQQRNITIEFAALDYADPNNISYAYKLDGLDTDWNYANRKRSVSYINLPHGEYKFLIKSTNSDGVWVNNEYTLAINVLPKFVETIWFWITTILLLFVLITIIVYVLFYVYRLRHQVDAEQQIADIKLRFFTNISHELRTPLTLIVGPVSELLNEDLPSKAKEYLRLVQKNVDRMLRLVNQILDFRKIQNHKMKLLVEETDIVQLTSTVMEHFTLLAKSRKIDFELISTTTLEYVWIDTDKIEKVIFNLLSNAFKYTPDGRSITVKIDRNHQSVCISIIDEGSGISTDKLETIFQRFETIINRNILEPSSGIGLSLTRELIEMHDGNISVTSKPGSGSCFCITIPIGKEHFLGNERVEFILSDGQFSTESILENENNNTNTLFANSEEKDNKKISILIVEDNEALRHFLRDILIADYYIIEADNGQEGYNKAQECLPEFIVSDVMMPVMDGLDMVKAIKENKDICHIPIVLLSAKASLDDRIKGLEYGIDDYITKPFSATYLKVRIASLIKTRKLLQEEYRKVLLADNTLNDRPDIFPAEPQIIPHDKLFIEQLMAFMEENITDSTLTVEDLAKTFALGRTSFYNKVKSILGVSPIEFINEIRIKRAVQLLNNGERNISQIAYLTGFDDPKYFSRCFKKEVGITPKQYRDRKKTI